ncbi:23 kDa integral membrane protein-like isoform X2 [Pararge aegeria]|uniref:Tetraspanin n=1 Tax=Pararge aegeria aegeria TaxID=348720 RepID=A0A8S4QSI4_9NEOP|nr:23 kDa integral membrane protein-like isoform X2 [Pararge aegeria]CAH2217318.1 jg5628 [Pararge aegeria aegeria]
MGCGTSFVKYVLFFFNLVVALFGLAVIGVGVAVLLKWSVLTDILRGHLTVAPWVFIVIGAIMFVIAFFGCCGAIRESHCMVVTYAIFLLVIIIAQVVLAVLMFTYGESIKNSLVQSVNALFDKRATDPSVNVVFNNIEEQLNCCGKNGPFDYGVAPPKSCCPHMGVVGSTINQCTVIDANKNGCAPVVGELYETWNKPIAGIAIGVACVEIVGALFALCLANSIRNMDRRYA